MGIKHFFYWLSHSHKTCCYEIPTADALVDHGYDMDVVAFDLNGVLHNAAQKIYRYGKHKNSMYNLFADDSKKVLRERVLKDIGERIVEMVSKVRPRKYLILCIDGVAGSAKMAQQRQRRFKSAKEQSKGERSPYDFDSNCITPGTQFMCRLNIYMKWFIRKQMELGVFQVPVVFSSERVPGEGEAKCITLIKKFAVSTDNVCMVGLDADLVMLCLSLRSRYPNIYIYRENMYKEYLRYVIDISKFIKSLHTTEGFARDFVCVCFLVGNDFLPSIPGVEIIHGGLNTFLSIYQTLPPSILLNGKIDFNILKLFLEQLVDTSKEILYKKYLCRNQYFEDPLLETYCDEKGLDYDGYKKTYYKDYVKETEREKVCREYIKGMEWVLEYYTNGIPNWTWSYPYHYAPLLDDLIQYDYTHFVFPKDNPCTPYQQLLCVLPLESKSLLPKKLQQTIETSKDNLDLYYPKEFVVDLRGKRAAWEGTVILPLIPIDILKRVYVSSGVEKEEPPFERNILFKKDPTHSFRYESRFGTIDPCTTNTQFIL